MPEESSSGGGLGIGGASRRGCFPGEADNGRCPPPDSCRGYTTQSMGALSCPVDTAKIGVFPDSGTGSQIECDHCTRHGGDLVSAQTDRRPRPGETWRGRAAAHHWLCQISAETGPGEGWGGLRYAFGRLQSATLARAGVANWMFREEVPYQRQRHIGASDRIVSSSSQGRCPASASLPRLRSLARSAGRPVGRRLSVVRFLVVLIGNAG
jgi:hypothetical protein